MDTKAKPSNSFGKLAHWRTAGSDGFGDDDRGEGPPIPQETDQNTPLKLTLYFCFSPWRFLGITKYHEHRIQYFCQSVERNYDFRKDTSDIQWTRFSNLFCQLGEQLQ